MADPPDTIDPTVNRVLKRMSQRDAMFATVIGIGLLTDLLVPRKWQMLPAMLLLAPGLILMIVAAIKRHRRGEPLVANDAEKKLSLILLFCFGGGCLITLWLLLT